MIKHIWISGLKISLIEERHPIFRNLKWIGNLPISYSVHVFENKNNDGGIIACSDAFGGSVAWAKYSGKNPLIGKEFTDFDNEEISFLKNRYPAFLEAINNL